MASTADMIWEVDWLWSLPPMLRFFALLLISLVFASCSRSHDQLGNQVN
jgi:hypothetical protein